MTEPDESAIFVVDGKGLEAMSLVLAASLARTHDTTRDLRVIAYVSPRSRKDLSPATRRIYKACNVLVRPLPDPAPIWAKPYPHGNKLLAARAPRPSRRTTFLDTDMLVTGQITGLADLASPVVCLVPEGRPTWGKTGDAWERAYRFAGLPLPTARVRLTRGREKDFLPYFNAGFVNFPDRIAACGDRGFGALWFDMAHDFDHRCPIANKRPWLDQITLPLTLARHDIPYQVLDDSYNYSVSDRARLRHMDQARVLHYHRAAYFNALPQSAPLLADLCAMTPAKLRPELDQLLRFFTEAKAEAEAAPEPAPEHAAAAP